MSKKNYKITIELNDKQQSLFEDWKTHIKALYGEIGSLTWTYSNCGIGDTIKVFSDKAKVELDLTDINSW